MENTLTVGELIEQLQRYDKTKNVYAYSVGFTKTDSYLIPLEFEKHTVDEVDNIIRISFAGL
jgi:hypothetical protein